MSTAAGAPRPGNTFPRAAAENSIIVSREVTVSEIDQRLDPARSNDAAGEQVAEPARPPASLLDGARASLGTAALHSGMDFRAPTGMAARTTAGGVVTRAGWAGGYGRMVEVDHGNGFATRYGHLSKILVTVGQKLKAGEEVGETGVRTRFLGPGQGMAGDEMNARRPMRLHLGDHGDVLLRQLLDRMRRTHR